MKKMRNFIVIALFAAGTFSCGSNNNTARSVNTVKEGEPSYVQDEKLMKYSENRTNSQGAAGAGSGDSYAGNAYRGSALKHENDTTEQNFTQPRNPAGDPELAADTADSGRSW
jgi:hypothetical protein